MPGILALLRFAAVWHISMTAKFNMVFLSYASGVAQICEMDLMV